MDVVHTHTYTQTDTHTRPQGSTQSIAPCVKESQKWRSAFLFSLSGLKLSESVTQVLFICLSVTLVLFICVCCSLQQGHCAPHSLHPQLRSISVLRMCLLETEVSLIIHPKHTTPSYTHYTLIYTFDQPLCPYSLSTHTLSTLRSQIHPIHLTSLSWHPTLSNTHYTLDQSLRHPMFTNTHFALDQLLSAPYVLKYTLNTRLASLVPYAHKPTHPQPATQPLLLQHSHYVKAAHSAV